MDTNSFITLGPGLITNLAFANILVTALTDETNRVRLALNYTMLYGSLLHTFGNYRHKQFF